MDHSHYTISQAAKELGVKDSVLRYWEEELDLRVRRNEQGHRYYTGYDIQMFMNIKELKKKGLQLRAIKELIPKISVKAPGSSDSKIKLLPMEGMEEAAGKQTEVLKQEGLKEEALKKTVLQEEALQDNASQATIRQDSLQETAQEGQEHEEKVLLFQSILERLIQQGLREKEEGEHRYRSLDETIRRHQLARRETAAAVESGVRRRRKNEKNLVRN